MYIGDGNNNKKNQPEQLMSCSLFITGKERIIQSRIANGKTKIIK